MCEAVSQRGGGGAGTYETDIEDVQACAFKKKFPNPVERRIGHASSDLIALLCGNGVGIAA